MIFRDEVEKLRGQNVKFVLNYGGMENVVKEGVLEKLGDSGVTAVINAGGEPYFVRLKNVYRVDDQIPSVGGTEAISD